MSTLNRLPFTKALVAALAAATGKPMGRNGFPDNGGQVFGVVYELPGSGYGGPPLGERHADAVWLYQVTCVGQGDDQARWLADRVRRAVLGTDANGAYLTAITVAGMTVIGREPSGDNGPDVEGSMVSVAERFAFHLTRSSA